MHDVIVIGGGPAGLYSAFLLAKKGWDVAVFEEHDSTGDPVHCTGVLAAEAYPEFEISPAAVLNPLWRVKFVGPSGLSIDYHTSDIEALVIDRRLFDQQLDRLARSSGVTVVSSARVTDLVVGGRSVTVSFHGRPAATARAVVLACGANYVLQRRLGMGLPEVFLQSAQLECPAAPLDAVEVHFGSAVAPRGFAWVVPVTRGAESFARVGLMCANGAQRHFRSFVDRVGPRCGIHAAAGRDAPDARLKMLPLAPIPRTYANRLVAVGDAAGLVKATTGGGIYYSLVSARLAAEVLDGGLAADDLGTSQLQHYEKAWRKRLGPELRAQLSLRLLANRLTDAEIDDLFELARTDGIMPIVRRTARFNQHRDLILALLKHPPARGILFRRFIKPQHAAAL